MRTLLVSGVFWLSACCSCPGDTPPPIFVPETEDTTSGSENTPEPAPARRGVDESGALGIAMEVAEEEGFDPALYSDVVLSDGDDHWVVQMRRPRVLRFLLVNVNKADGSATFQVRSQ